LSLKFNGLGSLDELEGNDKLTMVLLLMAYLIKILDNIIRIWDIGQVLLLKIQPLPKGDHIE
jgi:hypothetical protein